MLSRAKWKLILARWQINRKQLVGARFVFRSEGFVRLGLQAFEHWGLGKYWSLGWWCHSLPSECQLLVVADCSSRQLLDQVVVAKVVVQSAVGCLKIGSECDWCWHGCDALNCTFDGAWCWKKIDDEFAIHWWYSAKTIQLEKCWPVLGMFTYQQTLFKVLQLSD